MSFTQTVSSTDVTVEGTIEITPQSVSIVTGTVLNNNTTLGTVGAGKVWRVIAMDVNVQISGGAAGNNGKLTMGGNDVLQTYVGGLATTSPSNQANLTLSYEAALVLTEGETIVLTASGGGYACGSVAYVEEDA